MNLNFLIKKNHIFKKRKVFKVNHIIDSKHNMGIFTSNQIRFEFVYLKIFKKLFRKKYFKKKPIFMSTKFWLMVKPNFLLTMKSKNSRMGSGVGLYVRVCSLIKPNRPVLLLKYYSLNFIRKVIQYLKKKININFYLHNLKK